MDNYIIVMMDGSKILTQGVNLNTVVTIYNQNQTIAARIGRKSMTKHLVVAVAKEEALTKAENRNVTIKVGETLLYTVAESDAMLDTLTDDVNKKAFALVNDEILINRSHYQYAEMDENTNTETAETQAKA